VRPLITPAAAGHFINDLRNAGDKRHVLALVQHGRTQIVAVRQMLNVLESAK
jgi:hypothetical protein